MAFFCPVRIRRNKKKHGHLESDSLSGIRQQQQQTLPMGRITGSASIETLVRVGIEKENGFAPNSKMIVLHDFTPCVDDELEVKRGQIVNVLYQENDWVYVILSGEQQQPQYQQLCNNEGFIPASYCAQWMDTNETQWMMNHFKKKLPRNELTINTPNIHNSNMNGTIVERNLNHLNHLNHNLQASLLNHHEQVPQAQNRIVLEKSSFNNENDYLANYCNQIISQQQQLATGSSNVKNYNCNLNANYSPSTNNGGMESASQQQHNSIMNLDLISSSNHSHHNQTNPNNNPLASKSMMMALVNGHIPANHNNNRNSFLQPPSAWNIDSNHNRTTSAYDRGCAPSSSIEHPALTKSIVEYNQYQHDAANAAMLAKYGKKIIGEVQPFFKDPSGRYVMLYSFLAKNENDISVERGEIVTVLNKDDSHWYWIMKSDSQEGFVPVSFTYPADLVLRM